MKLLLICIMALASPGILSRVSAQEPRQTYRLNRGESYLLEIEIQQDTRSETMESEAITLYSRLAVRFTVDSLQEPDLIHLTARYDELSLSMLAPAMELDINSGSDRNPLLSSLMDSLRNTSFQVVTDARGALLGQRGLDERFRALSGMQVSDTTELDLILQTLREVYGPNAFSSLYSLFITVYPVISPMGNWTNDVTYYFNTRPVEMVNRYTLSRTTGDRMIIQGLGMIGSDRPYRERTEMGEVSSAVSGTQTYDLQMDRETGWPVKSISRQRVVIETTIVRSPYLPEVLKIPSYTETLFEVTGLKL